jgi:phosphoglycolate phosphatase
LIIAAPHSGHAVFDLDGTLIDSAPLITRILATMLEERGFHGLDPEAVRPQVTSGGRAMIEGVLGARCGEADAALDEFRARYAAAPTPPDSLYPGAREALAALRRRGVGLALFSNKPQALCEKIIGELGLGKLFEAVVGVGSGIPLKPDPTGYMRALAKAGGRLEASCYVGDSGLDELMAERCGVPMIRVTWGYGDAEPQIAGAALAREFAEVPDLVLGQLERRAAA